MLISKTSLKTTIFTVFLILVQFSFAKKGDLIYKPMMSKNEQTIKSSTPEDIKILALRVEFQSDDLKGTTGTGKFNSGYEYPDTLLLDTNHDKVYFEDQLTYLKNYYTTVSNGNVEFPKMTVIDTVVTLPHAIWYYNPNNGDDILEERLIELHKDAWNLIKDNHNISFKEYNTFIVYHAGSGQEFSPKNDITPFDIPSSYLSSQDFTDSAVVAYDGTIIDNGLILPECEWQITANFEGNTSWQYASMCGTSVIMFAHRLGIPNLYSQTDKKSCVGRFDPMDQGSGNFMGLLPAKPSAWVKEYKNWASVNNLKLPKDSISIKVNEDLYRVDLNEKEYLLLENRLSHTASQDTSAFAYDRDGKKLELFYDKNGYEKYEIEAGFKTIVRVDNYDFALPASGILVWHIDKSKTTASNILNNKVNDDYDNRGVYLKEADGSYDIGQSYWLLDAGYGTELGWTYDAYFDSNTVWTNYSNKELNETLKKISGKNKNVELSSASFPYSNTDDNLKTYVKLFNFSNPDTIMTFSFTNELLANLPIETGINNANLISFDQNDKSYQLVAGIDDDKLKIQVFNNDSLIANENQVANNFESVSLKLIEDKIFLLSNDSLHFYTYDINDGLSIGKNLPEKCVYGPVKNTFLGENGVNIFDENFVVTDTLEQFIGAEKYSIYSDNNGISFIVGLKNNSILLYDYINGNFKSQEISNLSGYNSDEIFAVKKHDGALFFEAVYANVSNVKFLKFDENLNLLHEFTKIGNFAGLSDYDNDGREEVLTFEDNKLSISNEFGYLENGFSMQLNRDYLDYENFFTFTSSKDMKKIVGVDQNGDFVVLNTTGEKELEFSLVALNSKFNLFNQNNKIYLSRLDNEGNLFNYNLDNGNLEANQYRFQGRFTGNGNAFLNIVSDESIDQSSIMKDANVYNWPNPASGNETAFRFFLNKAAKVTIDIYKLSGRKIKSLNKSFENYNEYFEMKWDISSIPTGIYLARLKITAGGKTEKYTVKVAITK